MIRAPWWTFLVAVAIGAGAMALWLRAGSSAALDELRAQRDSARAEAVIAEASKDSAYAVADSALEAHAALAASSDSTIAELTRRIQATTASAARTADEIRARVDAETAGLVDRMEAEWIAVVEAERATTETWRVRALSAEAGWADERLARAAAETQIEAERAVSASQSAVIRAQDAVIAELRRDNLINRAVAVAGSGKMCYDAIGNGSTGIAIGSCGAALYSALLGG